MGACGPRGCGPGLCCYLYLALWFVVHQREFQYTRGGTSGSPEAVGLAGFAEVSFSTEDGERIIGWWAPPPARAGVVLFLHGTPSTLSDTVWRLPDLRKSGLGVMAIDYRGYGDSTGTPSELGFRADARAAFDFIRAVAPASKVAVFGESLGTGIAVALARERPVAGVLLNAPYASVLRLFELRGPPLPYRWLLADQFNSEALIGSIGVPVMILHRTADETFESRGKAPLCRRARTEDHDRDRGCRPFGCLGGRRKGSCSQGSRHLDRAAKNRTSLMANGFSCLCTTA